MGRKGKRINRDTDVHDAETIRLREEGELLLLNRKEIITRVLDTAIRLWLGDVDPISVHILACVAHQNLNAIATAKGAPGLTLKERMQWEDVYSAYNDIKHANGDPEHRDQFVVENNEIMLFDCIRCFGDTFAFRSPWMNTCGSYLMLHRGIPPKGVLDEFFPGGRLRELMKLSRQAFVKKVYPLFLDAYKRGFW